MSREEMLRKFELACGDLPEDSPVQSELTKDPLPSFPADRKPGDDDLSLDSDTPSTLPALNQAPAYPLGGVGYPGDGSGPAPYLPGFGGSGGGGGVHNQPPPTNPPLTGSGGDNPPPPPTAEAPEPGSLVLMAAWFAGVAGAIHRRRQAA